MGIDADLARLPTAQRREEGDSVGCDVLDAGQTGHGLTGLVHGGHAGQAWTHLRRLLLGSDQPVLEYHIRLVVGLLLLVGYLVFPAIGWRGAYLVHLRPEAIQRAARAAHAPNPIY